MYKTHYTAYLPEPKTSKYNRPKEADPSVIKLDEYTKRLDQKSRKLSKVDEVCLTNLDKCKLYYTSARN